MSDARSRHSLREVDLDLLRRQLHVAVDTALDELVLQASPAPVEPEIDDRGPCEPFEYRRPDGEWETFAPATAFVVNGTAQARDVVVAFTERHAWGADRRRAIVFDASGLPHAPDRWYPWTEFVETDDGRFAAPIPNAARPRSYLKAGDPLPERFAGATVEPLGALIAAVRDGNSLRLVLGENDGREMVRHGHWVAVLRGRA
jgi:hypothetical protein